MSGINKYVDDDDEQDLLEEIKLRSEHEESNDNE